VQLKEARGNVTCTRYIAHLEVWSTPTNTVSITDVLEMVTTCEPLEPFPLTFSWHLQLLLAIAPPPSCVNQDCRQDTRMTGVL